MIFFFFWLQHDEYIRRQFEYTEKFEFAYAVSSVRNTLTLKQKTTHSWKGPVRIHKMYVHMCAHPPTHTHTHPSNLDWLQNLPDLVKNINMRLLVAKIVGISRWPQRKVNPIWLHLILGPEKLHPASWACLRTSVCHLCYEPHPVYTLCYNLPSRFR